MTRFVRKAWAPALLAAVFLGCSSAHANGLIQAYQDALGSDTTLQQAKAARDAAVQARPIAVSAFLPQLSASAGYDREKYRYASDDEGTPDDPSDPTVDSGSDTIYSGHRSTWELDVSQTLWSFESFHALQKANYDVAAAEATYRAAQQDLMLRVAEAYFNVLAAQDTLSANRDERSAYGALLDQAEKRLSTGLGARIGVEEAKAFYELTAQSVIDSETAVMDAERALVQIRGGDGQVTPLAGDIPLQSPQPDTVDQWVKTAQDNNFQIRAAELNTHAADRQLAATRAGRLPKISLQGSLGNNNLSPELGSDYRADSIGVNVTWPIFSGGLVRAQARSAAANLDASQASLEAVRRQVDRDTRDAFRGVVAGINRIRANQLAVDANKTALEASRNGVEVGTRTEFDLLNAQTNYYSALRSYYQSRYDYLTERLRLKAEAGGLVEADLQDVDALLQPPALSGGAATEGVRGLSADTSKPAPSVNFY